MRYLIIGIVVTVFSGFSGAIFASEVPGVPSQDWSWKGVFGTFDRAAQQRGLQVYVEVCAVCHGLKFVAYRNLVDLGYSEAEVKTFAKEFEVKDGPNEEGEMYMRSARPYDQFAQPFPNEQAARASNNGALPPDLSLIVEARQGGADYLYALLTGYAEPPEDFELLEGMSFNTYFPGQQIAMHQPLYEDGVEYEDGTVASVEQMAMDVSTFLAWTAEPYLEERKSLGLKVLLFLLVFTVMIVAVKRKVWANVP